MRRVVSLAACIVLVCSAIAWAQPGAPDLENVATMTPEQIAEAMKAIEGRLVVDYDEFRKTTYLDHYVAVPTATSRGMRFYPTIGYGGGRKWMFVVAYYSGKDWIFMDQVLVLVGDQVYETAKYPSWDKRVSQQVTTYGVYEGIIFQESDPGIKQITDAIMNAPLGTTIKVRFSGERNYDFALTRDEHQAWKEMLFYYAHLQP